MWRKKNDEIVFDVFDIGTYGERYGTPKDLRLASIAIPTNRPIPIPKKPAKYPKEYK